MMCDQGYVGLQGEWHDRFWAEEGEAAEGAVLRGFLADFPGRGLYVGSGSGRLFLPLVRDGEELVGLEPSAEMRARCEAEAEGFLPELWAGTWEDLPHGEDFDRIVIPAFTFQLFADCGAAAHKLASRLREGGGLYLTTFFPWAEMLEELPEGEWYLDAEAGLPEGGRAEMWTRHELDLEKRILTREHRFEELNRVGEVKRRQEVTERIRFFEEGELEGLSENAGFKVTQRIENFGVPMDEGEPASVETLWLVLDQ